MEPQDHTHRCKRMGSENWEENLWLSQSSRTNCTSARDGREAGQEPYGGLVGCRSREAGGLITIRHVERWVMVTVADVCAQVSRVMMCSRDRYAKRWTASRNTTHQTQQNSVHTHTLREVKGEGNFWYQNRQWQTCTRRKMFFFLRKIGTEKA